MGINSSGEGNFKNINFMQPKPQAPQAEVQVQREAMAPKQPPLADFESIVEQNNIQPPNQQDFMQNFIHFLYKRLSRKIRFCGREIYPFRGAKTPFTAANILCPL